MSDNNRSSKKRYILFWLIVIVFITPLVIFAGDSGESDENETAQQTRSELDFDAEPLVISDLESTPAQQTEEERIAEIKESEAYNNPKTITYEELFRNAEDYEGDFVAFTGEIIQVLGEPGNQELRVNVTEKGSGTYTYYDDTIYVFSYSDGRHLEGDIISFTGLASGVLTYESVMGGQITIPQMMIFEHDLVGRRD